MNGGIGCVFRATTEALLYFCSTAAAHAHQFISSSLLTERDTVKRLLSWKRDYTERTISDSLIRDLFVGEWVVQKLRRVCFAPGDEARLRPTSSRPRFLRIQPKLLRMRKQKTLP